MDEKHLTRHFLATIHYRGKKYLSINDVDFNTVTLDDEIRSPAEILNHINGLLLYSKSFFIKVEDTYPPQFNFIEEVYNFDKNIYELDSAIACNPLDPEMSYDRLIQGPLSDIMLHLGEISMLRKVSKSPIDDVENYINADIQVGLFETCMNESD